MLCLQLSNTEFDNAEFKQIVNEFESLNISEQIYESVFLQIESKLRTHVAPAFWKYFEVWKEEDRERGFYQFQYAVFELQKEYAYFQNILKRLKLFKEICHLHCTKYNDTSENEIFNAMLKEALLSELPADFVKIVYAFYSTSFKVFVNSQHESGGIRKR